MAAARPRAIIGASQPNCAFARMRAHPWGGIEMRSLLLRRGVLAVALASIACGLVLLSVAAAATSGAAATGKKPEVRTITSWPVVDPDGSFAESLALGRDGFL